MKRVPSCEPGGGIKLLDWPGQGGVPRGGSKKHCAVCGECTAVKCWNGSREHVWCRRHELMADKLLGRVYAEKRSE